MTDSAVAVRSNGSLANWGSRDEVRELKVRLAQMLVPGGARLDANQIAALAQASVAHGLDPLNGEIWIIPGSGVMIGVKGLRKKAREQVKGNFWIDFRRIENAEERRALGIPETALAFEARLFDSENLRQYADTIERLLKAGIPWQAVETMVGSKPFTLGIGFATTSERSKMELVNRAMKRAEADALKRRFDVPFGLSVETDSDAPEFQGEWIEGSAAAEHPAPTAEQAAAHARDKAAVFPDDETLKQNMGVSDVEDEEWAKDAEPEVSEPAPAASPNPAKVKVQARQADWRKALAELVTAHPKYQTVVKGKATGHPNMFHILAAAGKCGFAVIDDGNFDVVIEAISKRAGELEPA